MKTFTRLALAGLLIGVSTATLAQTTATRFQKVFSTALSDKANDIKMTSTGDYVIAGSTQTVIDSATFTTMDYAWVVKTDSAGNIKWSQTYGATGQNVAAFSIEEGDNGYYVFGNSADAVSNLSVASLLHIDVDGNVLWCKTYTMYGNEYGAAIKKINANAYVLCGKTFNSVAGEDNEVFLLKVDSSGNVIWGQGYNGDVSMTDVGRTVSLTSDGGFLITGDSYFIPTHDYYVLVIRTDSNGHAHWIKTYADTHNSRGLGGYEFNNGYILGAQMIGAGTAADMMLIRTDTAGEVIWSRTYGGSSGDFAHAMLKPDSTFTLLGESSSFYSTGITNAWIVKTDTAGNLLSSFTYGDTTMPTSILAAITTPHHGLAITGISNAIGLGQEDFYFSKMIGDSTGCLEYATIPTVDTITTSALSFMNEDSLVTTVTDVTGVVVTGILDSASGLLDSTLCFSTVTVPADTIIVDTPLNVRPQITTSNELYIYPNPAKGAFTVAFASPLSISSIWIFNSVGEDVSKEFAHSQTGRIFSFTSHNVTPGIYWIQMMTDNGRSFTERILLE